MSSREKAKHTGDMEAPKQAKTQSPVLSSCSGNVKLGLFLLGLLCVPRGAGTRIHCRAPP